VTATILLLILLLLVAVLVSAYVLWPLWRGTAAGAAGPAAPADAAAVARAVLRERRRELDAALAHLPPDAPERLAALAEFAAQADDELGAAPVQASERSPDPAPRRRPWAAALIGIALAAPSFALYLIAGAPEAASPEFRAATREPASLEELVADLQARLERDPGQLDAWRLLGRAELARGRFDAARVAYERALALAPGDAQARADLADAVAQSQGAVLEGRPIALLREALTIDPRNPKALALAGAYAVTQRDYPGAIALWNRLLEVLPPDSDQARQVSGFVADLRAGRAPQLGADQARAQPPGPGPAAGAPTAPGPATAPPPSGAAGPGSGALAGRIELERRLGDRLRADDTLFVVARRIDDAGRPVGPPVAVLRARGADLPLAFALDDRMAMSPAASLSALPPDARVIVVARLSRSGEAQARPGDLQGASQPVAPGASGVRVLIDAVVD
jgi:cytochrome c-type biogenesis protein CcmH